MENNETKVLDSVIDSLLSEPFAKENAFAETTLDQIGDILQDSISEFETTDGGAANPLQEALKESFDRCKAAYCTLLMELESMHAENLLHETPARLKREDANVNSEAVTEIFESAVTVPPAIPMTLSEEFTGQHPEDIANLSENTQTGLHNPIDASGDLKDEDLFEPIENTSSLPNLVAEEPVPEAAPEVLGAIEEEASEIALETPPNLDPDMDPDLERAMPVDQPPPPPPDPEPRASLEIEPSIELELEPRPVEPSFSLVPIISEHIPDAPPETTEEPVRIPASPTFFSKFLAQNPMASDLLRVADFLKGFEGHFPVAAPHRERLIAQAACSAVESDLYPRMQKCLPNFWKDREPAIAALLDGTNKKFELHPILKAAVNQIAVTHPEWLFDSKFPHSAALNSLRYIAATNEFEKFRPTLLDMAVLIFFFGQENTLGGYPLKNRLELSGIDRELLIELTLRVLRLHKFRGRAISTLSGFTAEDLTTIQADAERIFEILKSSATQPVNQSLTTEQVA